MAGLIEIPPADDRVIHGLSLDSRSTQPGDLFLACAGQDALMSRAQERAGATARTHGQDFIGAALKAGAVAVLCEAVSALNIHSNVPMFALENLHGHLGTIADRFYAHPSRALDVIAVTGTNGKTSVSHFLAETLSARAKTPCGVIGTLGNGFYGQLHAGTHTTPDALQLHALLDELRSKGASHVALEASSHGLQQGRVNSVALHTAIFTNLSRDHLDYHGAMTHYAAAKSRLFQMPGLRHAVINADDAFGRELLDSLPKTVHRLSYGLATKAVDVRGDNLQLTSSGLTMNVSTPWGQGRLRSSLLGRFNASNLLATLSTLLLLGVPLTECLQRLATVHTVAGRMERFGGTGQQPTVVVDYAHTPDALEQVLRTLREHSASDAQLWCVFGCGGNRDQGKRPLMGSVAERFADRVVLTHDNPRSEDPQSIIAAILAGMSRPGTVYIEPARGQAISFALNHASPHDVVLIAGKGHEDYQLMGAQRLPFSDRQQVVVWLAKAAR
jgi:UDP-N-acetylmuramoyl-L-alanyl-D-glutamate--2,6-diaminopimelate ligase